MRHDHSTAMSDKWKRTPKTACGPDGTFKLLIRMGFILPSKCAICPAAFEIAAFDRLQPAYPQSYPQKRCTSIGE
jgi:hypothetical protein